LTAACIGVACLVVLLLCVIRNYDRPQVEGEYIEIEQADRLLAELGVETPQENRQTDADNQRESDDDTGITSPEYQSEETGDQSAYLTYGDYLQILSMLYEKYPEVYRKEDYEYDQKQALSASYLKKHLFLKTDFLKVYYALSEKIAPDKNIREESFLVLGTSDEVFDPDGQPAPLHGVLVAKGGGNALEGAEFYEIAYDDYKNALYQTVTAVMSLDRVVLVLHTDPGEFTLKRAWIGSNTEEGMFVRYQDRMLRFPYQREVFDDFEKIADVTVADGTVSRVDVYRDMIGGKLLGITEDAIELEGAGSYRYEPDLQIYKLYGEKEAYSLNDLKIGYAFTDFVLDGKVIIAALVVREEDMENIRVLIKSQDFASNYHDEVEITPDCDFVLAIGEEQTEYRAGTTLTFKPGDEALGNGRVRLIPQNLTGRMRIDSLRRAQGTPAYRGTLELIERKEGIAVINELLLEEYLYSVVPSEMPSSYSMDALKAQAVSARTYAYKNMQTSGLPELGAHVDDSTSYQVYNNIEQNERTTLAVRETQGKVMKYQGGLADTYYYSTSCGYSTNPGVWAQSVSAKDAHLKAKHLNHATADAQRDTEIDDVQQNTDTTDEQQDAGVGDEEENTDTADTQQGTDTDDAIRMQDEEAFRQMITSVDASDFEKDLDYYRWTYETVLDTDLMMEKITERQKVRPDQILIRQKDGSFAQGNLKDTGKVTGIEVTGRTAGGAACELTIYGKKQTIRVLSEYNIRYILLNDTRQITKQNGKSADAPSLLPSGFILVETKGEEEVETVRITGGGYGHGIGMSQNGAKVMGEEGYTYDQILKFFFEGVEVIPIDQL